MRVLVVYYSRSGFTKKLAIKLAENLNADIEELIDKNERKGFWGFMISGYEAVTRKEAKIFPLIKNPENYELVIVCSPVWVSSLSSPVRAFLNKNKDKIKNIAFISSYKSSAGKIFIQMEQISKKPLAEAGFTENDIKSQNFVNSLKSFTEKLNLKNN